jgi:hypothetical protein
MSLRRGALAGLLAAALTASWVAPGDTQHHHHYPSVPSGATKVELRDDPDARVLTVLVGPVSVPPRTEHATALVPSVTVPFDGWFVAYKPRIVDEKGATTTQRVLHHFNLLNTSRPSVVCPRQAELVFGAGSELANWPPVPDVGYRVTKGMPLRISLMLTNPTDEPVSNAYVALEIQYRRSADAQLKAVYPAWFMVTHCGPTMYDLSPGRNVTASEFTVVYDGKLLGVGGHIHDFGREIRLDNVTRNENIATLKTALDTDGRLLSVSTLIFPRREAYRLKSGDVVKVTAVYDNPTGRLLRKAAMGFAVTYFLPDNEQEVANLKLEPSIRFNR